MWIFRWVFLPPPLYFFLLHSSIPWRRIRPGRRSSYSFDPPSPYRRHGRRLWSENGDCRTIVVSPVDRNTTAKWSNHSPPNQTRPFFCLYFSLLFNCYYYSSCREKERKRCNCCCYYYYYYCYYYYYYYLLLSLLLLSLALISYYIFFCVFDNFSFFFLRSL
jgi:hypothetical protein